jgi:hypothetical protein
MLATGLGAKNPFYDSDFFPPAFSYQKPETVDVTLAKKRGSDQLDLKQGAGHCAKTVSERVDRTRRPPGDRVA